MRTDKAITWGLLMLLLTVLALACMISIPGCKSALPDAPLPAKISVPASIADIAGDIAAADAKLSAARPDIKDVRPGVLVDEARTDLQRALSKTPDVQKEAERRDKQVADAVKRAENAERKSPERTIICAVGGFTMFAGVCLFIVGVVPWFSFAGKGTAGAGVAVTVFGAAVLAMAAAINSLVTLIVCMFAAGAVIALVFFAWFIWHNHVELERKILKGGRT